MKILRTFALCVAASAIGVAAQADGASRHKRTPAAQVKSAPAVPVTVPAAGVEQLQAMALTLFGSFDCGDKDVLVVTPSVDHAGYVEVEHGKHRFMMKPVRSDTGAVRLEDVSGEMLMVQIPSKSMLMDTKLGKRVADACRNDAQKKEVDTANSLGISAPGQVDTAAPATPASLTARR